jgi:DNA-binding MarR family transcriptional regulator
METKTTTSRNGIGKEGIKRWSVLSWLRLARSYTKIDRETADHVGTFDLSVAQFDVLAQIGAHEGLSQNKLAEALLVTKGNVSQLVTKMEARGLVERRSAPSSRDNRLYLTEKGRCLYDEVVPEQERLIDKRFSCLSTDEQEQLHGLLVKLDRSIER